MNITRIVMSDYGAPMTFPPCGPGEDGWRYLHLSKPKESVYSHAKPQFQVCLPHLEGEEKPTWLQSVTRPAIVGALDREMLNDLARLLPLYGGDADACLKHLGVRLSFVARHYRLDRVYPNGTAIKGGDRWQWDFVEFHAE